MKKDSPPTPPPTHETPQPPNSRVPFFIRGPGISEGATIHQLVSNPDIMPTILELANVTASAEITDRIDGTSFAALVSGDDQSAAELAEDWRDAVLLE